MIIELKEEDCKGRGVVLEFHFARWFDSNLVDRPFLRNSFQIFVDTCYGQEWSTQIIGGIIFWLFNKTKQEHLVDCVLMQRLALDSWLCFRIKLLNQLIRFNLFLFIRLTFMHIEQFLSMFLNILNILIMFLWERLLVTLHKCLAPCFLLFPKQLSKPTIMTILNVFHLQMSFY